MPHILVVDDDNRILKLLKKFLEKNDFTVTTAISAMEASDLLGYYVFDLIILDVMLPKVTGIDFARSIKSKTNSPPIVMLTALSEAADRVAGLEAGANDYLSKPFEPRELLLRINNLINSKSQDNQKKSLIYFGNNIYDVKAKELKRNDAVVSLSFTEQKLLEILIENLNQPVNRSELSSRMGDLSERSIDVQIARLRAKIEDAQKPNHLKTIRNFGYILNS